MSLTGGIKVTLIMLDHQSSLGATPTRSTVAVPKWPLLARPPCILSSSYYPHPSPLLLTARRTTRLASQLHNGPANEWDAIGQQQYQAGAQPSAHPSGSSWKLLAIEQVEDDHIGRPECVNVSLSKEMSLFDFAPGQSIDRDLPAAEMRNLNCFILSLSLCILNYRPIHLLCLSVPFGVLQ